MRVTEEEVARRQAVLHIELEPEDMEQYLNRAYRSVIGRTVIPGFRKGKAPRRVLERYVGREALISEIIATLLSESTSQAIDKQELVASGRPQVDLVQLDPTVLKATVPLRPTVELGDYQDIHLEEDPVEVSEEQVQNILEEVRRNSAPWEPIERPVQEGDMVTMSVWAEANAQTLADQQDVSYVVQEENDHPVAGFARHLLGISPGEERAFSITLPDDYEDTDLAGAEAQFRVSVSEIKARQLPELDDEFAKGVGEGYESLEQLRERIREDLQAQAKREADQGFQERVVSEVVGRSTVELPSLLVEEEIDHSMEHFRQQLSRGGLSMESYLETVGKSQEELREELRDQAIDRLTRTWVLSKIAEDAGIEVTDEDIQEEIERMLGGAGEQADALREVFSNPNTQASLHEAILSRKTNEYLTRIARGEADQEPSAAAPALEEETTSGAQEADDEREQATQDETN